MVTTILSYCTNNGYFYYEMISKIDVFRYFIMTRLKISREFFQYAQTV